MYNMVSHRYLLLTLAEMCIKLEVKLPGEAAEKKSIISESMEHDEMSDNMEDESDDDDYGAYYDSADEVLKTYISDI